MINIRFLYNPDSELLFCLGPKLGINDFGNWNVINFRSWYIPKSQWPITFWVD